MELEPQSPGQTTGTEGFQSPLPVIPPATSAAQASPAAPPTPVFSGPACAANSPSAFTSEGDLKFRVCLEKTFEEKQKQRFGRSKRR